MNRRETVLALAAFGTAPLRVEAQPGAKSGKVWRIGVIRPGPDDAVWRENFAPFRNVMRENGFIEGKNLTFEYRVRPGSPEEILEFANQLVRAKVDVLVAISPVGVDAAVKATSSIPILANDMESDPIERKFAASLARPGGNLTGTFLDFPEMGGKWLQLLKETMPKLTRAAVLWNPAIGPYLMKGVEAAGVSLRVQILRCEARAEGDIARAITSAASQRADALVVLSSPVLYSARTVIADLALKHRLPAIMAFSGFADAGGMMTYGPHLPSMFGQQAGLVVKILNGAQPKDLPIERPTRFEMVVNIKTAKLLGVSVPNAVLLRADRVIE